MSTVYVVEIVPTKESKSAYILGVYSSYELAKQAGSTETTSKHASWWTQYRITKTQINNPRDIEAFESTLGG
jgi:hypothetical protein